MILVTLRVGAILSDTNFIHDGKETMEVTHVLPPDQHKQGKKFDEKSMWGSATLLLLLVLLFL